MVTMNPYAKPAGGQVEFFSSTTWVVPAGVTSISAVCVGPGQVQGSNGGRGGDLRYAVTLAVTPGETLTITIGTSGTVTGIYRSGTPLLAARGGVSGTSSTVGGNIGGGNGGTGSAVGGGVGGGGGAGGYSGNGGNGGAGQNT